MSELLRDVVQSRSATAARISQYERHVEEHTKQARYYTEKARTLKTDLAKMDAYLTEAWTEYASSSTQLRHPKPKASRKAKSKYHGWLTFTFCIAPLTLGKL